MRQRPYPPQGARPWLAVWLAAAALIAPMSSSAASWESDRVAKTMCNGCPPKQVPGMDSYFFASPVFATGTQLRPGSVRGVCRVPVPGDPRQYVAGYFEMRALQGGAHYYSNCEATINGLTVSSAGTPGSTDYLKVEAGRPLSWGNAISANSVEVGPPGPDGLPNRACRARRHDPGSSPERMAAELFVGHEGEGTCLYSYLGQEQSSGPDYQVLVERLTVAQTPSKAVAPQPPGQSVATPPPPPPQQVHNCSFPRIVNYACAEAGIAGEIVFECSSHCANGYHGVCTPVQCDSTGFTPQKCQCQPGSS